jgi:nitric oxide reductase subunit B
MTTGVGLMSAALTFAGVLQTHLERVMGQDYMDVQQQLGLFYWIRLGGGVLTALGLVMFLVAVLVPGRRAVPAGAVAFAPAE